MARFLKQNSRFRTGKARTKLGRFLSPSLPKISCATKETATRTDVAFYFMPGAEQWSLCKIYKNR
jgi:hypothetical protein